MVGDKYLKMFQIRGSNNQLDFNKQQSFKIIKEALNKQSLTLLVNNDITNNHYEGTIELLEPTKTIFLDYTLCWGDGAGMNIDFKQMFKILSTQYREPTLQLYIDEVDYLNNIKPVNQKKKFINQLTQELSLIKQHTITLYNSISNISNSKGEYIYLVFKNDNKFFNYTTRIVHILREQDTINKIVSNNKFKLISKINIHNNHTTFVKLLHEQLSKIIHFKGQDFIIIDNSISDNDLLELYKSLQ